MEAALQHKYGIVGYLLTHRRNTVLFFVMALVGSVGGHRMAQTFIRYMDHRHEVKVAAALASPITKWDFIVEDTHGQGKFMILRRGTWHLKLQCEGSQWKKDANWSTSDGCSSFHIGDKIILEKWDTPEGISDRRKVTYVNKMTDFEGENDYVYYDGDN